MTAVWHCDRSVARDVRYDSEDVCVAGVAAALGGRGAGGVHVRCDAYAYAWCARVCRPSRLSASRSRRLALRSYYILR